VEEAKGCPASGLVVSVGPYAETKEPIAKLNRIVVLSLIKGPGAAMNEFEEISANSKLGRCAARYAVEAHLCQELGQEEEAKCICLKAASITVNQVERDHFLRLAAQCNRLG